jgi:flagellar basal-body rod modification protein FlgD
VKEGLKNEANAGGKMAALASGIFNKAMTAAQTLSPASATPLSNPAANAAGTADSSSSSSSSATISANDFLTLLVTEMKNQDPTANTDPNEYINQLVNVNSLEQLIDINQNLSTALGSSNSSSAGTAIGQAASTSLPQANAVSAAGSPASASASKPASGNLSIPAALPAAQSVAHALGGTSRAQPIATRLHESK